MKRITLTLTFVLLAASPAWSAGSDRPIGNNCDLDSPPASAGEEMSHGVVLRIFPRAKDIDTTYTGCQALLAPDGKKWAIVSLTEIVSGDPVRIWSQDEKDPAVLACRFKRGKVVGGNPDSCPMPQFLLIKSLAPGCVRTIQEAVAKHGLGAPQPPGCKYE